MYKFKYHPDNIICRNGEYKPYAQFMSENPSFPMPEGNFFELKQNGSFEIITNGNHTKIKDLEPYQELIQAIEVLDGDV